MLDTRFPPWPSFTDDEITAVSQVLRSGRVNYWTGQEARAFEAEFVEWTGSRHAIALANGTVALDLALHGIGIGTGDEVIVTPRSFIASASCVVNAGAIPVFADVDRDSGNLTAATIAAALTPRTRAVIAVHLAGWPCDMQPIMELAAAHGLRVIEDCAQAHGARYRGSGVGTIGHVGAWSFCQDKIMTTGGEGGMLATNDEAALDFRTSSGKKRLRPLPSALTTSIAVDRSRSSWTTASLRPSGAHAGSENRVPRRIRRGFPPVLRMT